MNRSQKHLHNDLLFPYRIQEELLIKHYDK